MVKCSFPDSILESKMGDSLEVRISIIENIQEKFRYDIQEMKVQLVKLTKLTEGHTGAISENTYGSPSFPLKPIVPPHTDLGSRIPINDIQAMNLRSQSRAMFHQMFIIFIQIVNLKSQSEVTFSREFTT